MHSQVTPLCWPQAQRAQAPPRDLAASASSRRKLGLHGTHEQHAALKRRCADVRACMTEGLWRGCADHVVRPARSTGLSSDSCIRCSDLLWYVP